MLKLGQSIYASNSSSAAARIDGQGEMSDIGVMELVEADVGVSMRRVCVGQCVSEVNTDTVLQNARVKESR